MAGASRAAAKDRALPSERKNLIQMAVVGAAQGVRGEVRVKSFSADPAALSRYGPLVSADGRRFEIDAIRPHKDLAVVRFKGILDRDTAEALTGTALFVERQALPADLDEDEFYHADLIGLQAVTRAGEPVGTIIAVQNFGGGDLLEIARTGQSSLFVPFTRAAVPEIDIVAGQVRLDPVAAGLVDDESDVSDPGQAPDVLTARARRGKP